MILDFGTAPAHRRASPACSTSRSLPARPRRRHEQGGLTNIGGGHVFRFEGRVQVMFNTTLVSSRTSTCPRFPRPAADDSPTHYTIFKSQPNLSGTAPLNPGGSGEIYIKAKVQGSITLFDVLTLTGFLSIGVGVSGANGVTIEVAGAASTSIQYIGTLSGDLHFIFFTDYIDSSSVHHGAGLVGRAHLALADGGAIPGVSIGGQVILEVNTFVGAISVDTFEVDPTTGLLVLDSVTGLPVISRAGHRLQHPGPGLRPAPRDRGPHGHLDRPPERRGSSSSSTTARSCIAASLDADMTFGTFGGVHVHGGFLIDSTGLALSLSAALGVNFGHDLGLSFNVSATVELNTSSSAKTLLGGHVVQSGFFLAMHGDVEFLGFASASGDVTLRINAGTFELSFNVQLHLGPIDVAASGFAGIYAGSTEAHKGIVLRLAVSLDVNVLEIIKISASGELRLNTTNIARQANGVTIGANSFRLSLNGSIKILEVINLSASFDLIVGGGPVTVGSGAQRHTFNLGVGEWVFAFSASADFFGLASMSISGWIDSRGEFDVQLNGQLTLGSSSFGLVGQFSVRVYLYKEPLLHFHLDFSASVEARLFGFSFASLGIDGSFDALQSAGQDHIDVIVTVTVRIKILFVKVSKTAHFNIGTIRLPPPIFLAGDAGPDPQHVGQYDWNGGDLYLNIGDRASINGLGSGPDEGFTVEHVGGTASSETVKVRSGGREQIFNNVTSIHALRRIRQRPDPRQAGRPRPGRPRRWAGRRLADLSRERRRNPHRRRRRRLPRRRPAGDRHDRPRRRRGRRLPRRRDQRHDEPGRGHAHRRHGPGLDLRRHRQRHDLRRRPDGRRQLVGRRQRQHRQRRRRRHRLRRRRRRRDQGDDAGHGDADDPRRCRERLPRHHRVDRQRQPDDRVRRLTHRVGAADGRQPARSPASASKRWTSTSRPAPTRSRSTRSSAPT